MENLFNGLYNNEFEVVLFPHTPMCWVVGVKPEYLLELLFHVSSCKNPIIEKHSFLSLVLLFCMTMDELYKMAFAHWMQLTFANVARGTWCWQQNWFLRPPNVFALKINFQLVLLDFVLRLRLRMCKPSRRNVWTAAWGTGVEFEWSHQAGLRKGCCSSEELSCPLPALFPAVPLCKQQCWGGHEVKLIQNVLQLLPAVFLLLISQCNATRAGAGPGEGAARSRSWSRRWQGGATMADHRALYSQQQSVFGSALRDCER